jgi:hypothetical protein
MIGKIVEAKLRAGIDGKQRNRNGRLEPDAAA